MNKISHPTSSSSNISSTQPSAKISTESRTIAERTKNPATLHQATSIQALNEPESNTLHDWPAQFWKSREIQQAEWGWRKVILDWMAGSIASAENASDQKCGSLEQIIHPMIERYWSMVEQLVSQNDMEKLVRTGIMDKPQIRENRFSFIRTRDGLAQFISFAKLNLDDMKSPWVLPIRKEILLNRFSSAVVVNPFERNGAGLLSYSTHSSQRARVFPWRAKRQTKLAVGGKIMHHMVLNLVYERQPVVMHITTLQPLLFVHIETGHEKFLKKIQSLGAVVKNILQPLGWELKQWSYHFEKPGDAE